MDEVYVDDEIVLVDEEGVEHTVNILFTYDNEDRGAQYVLFYDKNNPEEIIVARYYEDEENSLHAINERFNYCSLKKKEDV